MKHFIARKSFMIGRRCLLCYPRSILSEILLNFSRHSEDCGHSFMVRSTNFIWNRKTPDPRFINLFVVIVGLNILMKTLLHHYGIQKRSYDHTNGLNPISAPVFFLIDTFHHQRFLVRKLKYFLIEYDGGQQIYATYFLLRLKNK